MKRNGKRRKTWSPRRNSVRRRISKEKKSRNSGTTRTTSEPKKWTGRRTRNRTLSPRRCSANCGRKREKSGWCYGTQTATSEPKKRNEKKSRNKTLSPRRYSKTDGRSREKSCSSGTKRMRMGSGKWTCSDRSSACGSPESGRSSVRRMSRTG